MKGVFGIKADIIVKGTIYDGLEQKPYKGMIAVKHGVYCYVGTEGKFTDLCDENTHVVFCDDGLVLPNLYEGHAHVSSGIDLFGGVNLYGLKTPEQYLQAIEDYAKVNPQSEYIIGRGFLNGNFDKVGPTAAMLDRVAVDRYVVLNSEDCHSSWVNSKVLQAVGIEEQTKELPNGVIVRYPGTNQPTGWLKEKEMDRVKELLPVHGIRDFKEAILKYQELAISNGIGCTFEPILNDKNDINLRLTAYRELDLENKLKMKFRVGVTMNPEDDIDTILQFVKDNQNEVSDSHYMMMGIKVFIDGVIEGHTAYLLEPYADQPEDCSYNMWSQEKLNTLFVKAAELEIEVHVHAIGDAAVASALEAFGEAFCVTGRRTMRNCITHLQLVAKDQFQQFNELGIIAVTNPFWHYKNPAYYDCLEVPFLGKERADREYPMKSFFDHGVIVTQASDWPVSFCFHPFLGMEIAITRREAGNTEMDPLNEAEKVTVGQMLQALTINGAYQMKLEQKSGSIEVGKRADFIMVDRNVFEIPQAEIAGTVVLRHFINGNEVYRK
jgi:predicted amidohydrolase YtcJ